MLKSIVTFVLRGKVLELKKGGLGNHPKLVKIPSPFPMALACNGLAGKIAET